MKIATHTSVPKQALERQADTRIGAEAENHTPIFTLPATAFLAGKSTKY